MSAPVLCPTCGALLNGSSIGGVCVSCLGRMALGVTTAGSSPRRLERVGDYELIEELARGGMGVVYRARQSRLKRLVALKLLLRGDLANAEARRRFELEAEAAAALQHPGIVTVFEVGESDGEHFIAMELIEGPSLDEELRRSLMSPESAARCLHTIAEAVAYAHNRGVLHRDLKPSNILLGADGRPHITDFGMARLADSSASLTLAGRTFGSPNYMPPEQADPFRGPATPASDVFSLGAVLYHALTGRPPFVAETLPGTLRQVLEEDPIPLRRLRPEVPADLENVCLKCLQKEPTHRYASAQALADDLGKFLRGEPVTARPVSAPARAWRWAKRHPALASLSTGLFLALAAIAVITSITSVRVSQSRREAEQRANESRRNLVRSLVVTGNRYLADDDAQRALPWFLRAWELETNSVERRIHEARLATTLHYVPELTRVWSSDRRIEWLDISPDGSRVIVADGGSNVCVWPVAADDTNAIVIERNGPIFFARFSPDGGHILTSGMRRSMLSDSDGRPDTNNFTHELHFGDVSKRVFPIFSADGTKLLTAFTNRISLRTLDAEDATEGRKIVRRLISFPAIVTAIALFPDGRRCVVATGDKKIRVVDGVTGRRAGPEFLAAEPVRVLALNSTATHLAAVSGASRINVWNLAETNAAPIEFFHTAFTYQCEFVLNDRAILTTSYENSARLWDAESGKFLHAMRHDGGVYRAMQIDNNGLAISCSWDGTVRAWDLNRGLPATFPHLTHAGPVLALDFDRKNQRVLSGSWDGTVRLHTLTNSLPVTLEGKFVPYPFAPARFALLGLGTTNVTLMSPITGKPIGPSLLHDRRVRAFGVTTNGELLATLTVNGRVTLWNCARGERILEITNLAARDIELTPDGRRLLAIDTNNLVQWFDASNGRSIDTPSNAPSIRTLLPSPDSQRVALLNTNAQVRIFSAADGQLVSGPFAPQTGAQLMMWSPDSTVLAIASGRPGGLDNRDQSMRLWEAHSGKDLGIELRHRDDIRSIAFSSDGQWIATGSEDYEAKIWDRRTGGTAVTLRHNGWVVALAFSPDGKVLATASSDGFLRLWQVPDGEAVGPTIRTGAEPKFVGFAPSGESLVAGFAQQCLRWDLTLPPYVRAGISRHVAVASGMRLTAEGVLQPLAGPELVELWKQRSK